MTKTIEELILQKEDLEEQIAAEQKACKSAAIEDAKALVKAYNLNADDLGLKATRKKYVARPSVVKYRNGNLTWSGRGRMPSWLKSSLALGGSLNDYLV